MTSEAPPEATPDDPYSDVPCSNCGDPVKRRRPSMTGKHFCGKRNCVRAKDRFYYRRRAEGSMVDEGRRQEEARQLVANFVHAAVHGERADCGTCGRPDVVAHYAHPVPDWSAACSPADRLAVSTDPILTTLLMRSVYPS